MSKESFSKKIYETIYTKIKTLEYTNPNAFFKYDENFELVLCLAYMTLSKESIIKKDIKNSDKLGRLTKMVSTTDIDAVFAPSFNSEMPIIYSASEYNNLWILDNIRDSIMHGSFDIDEENKCFKIRNTQYARELEADIPFSWFIAYTKNDIFSKKVLDKYTVRGFFYNTQKTNRKITNPQKEIYNNILYEVVIKGNSFNIREIENRIKELFEEYKYLKISNEEINNYQGYIPKTKYIYNHKYLISFLIIKDKIINQLKQEYPDLQIRIFINERKHKLFKRISKKLSPYNNSYPIIIDQLNNEVSSKSNNLIKYLSTIIENLDTIHQEQPKLNKNTAMITFNRLLEGKNIKYTKYQDINFLYQKNLSLLRTICLNAYGLATLVINQESLYNPYFLNQSPRQYNIISRSKQPLIDNLNEEKSTLIKLLEKEITLFEKETQLNKCKSPHGITVLQNTISSLNTEISDLLIHFNYLREQRSINRECRQETIPQKLIFDKEKIDVLIRKNLEYFNHAPNKRAKNNIKNLIKRLYDDYIKYESYNAFWLCNNMSETLTIIRNCFSHLERIYIGKNKGLDTTIILSDYDNTGEKSGEIITTYKQLLYLLTLPLENNLKSPDEEPKTLTKKI